MRDYDNIYSRQADEVVNDAVLTLEATEDYCPPRPLTKDEEELVLDAALILAARKNWQERMS